MSFLKDSRLQRLDSTSFQSNFIDYFERALAKRDTSFHHDESIQNRSDLFFNDTLLSAFIGPTFFKQSSCFSSRT